MNKMKGIYMLAITTLFTLSIFGCVVANKTFSENNYTNSKPDKEARNMYISAHPELDPGIRNLIESGIVGTGMSEEEVTASWGKPDRIETTSEFGADEIWYYWDNPKFHPRVYFSKGIVIKVD